MFKQVENRLKAVKTMFDFINEYLTLDLFVRTTMQPTNSFTPNDTE